MSDTNVYEPVEATALIRVDKTDGSTMFYRVDNGESTQISEDEYNQETETPAGGKAGQ